MPKRKSHPKLPSGWGSIRYLGKGRRNPYAVHPPCTEIDEKGNYIRPKALCYVSSWYVGFAVLNSYRAGTYQEGDEVEMERTFLKEGVEEGDLGSLVDRILGDYGRWSGANVIARSPTFQAVYEGFFEWKFGPKASKNLSVSVKRTSKMMYENLSSFHNRPLKDITVDQLQNAFNSMDLSKGSIQHIRSVLSEMYDWAIDREIVEKNLGRKIVVPGDAKAEEHGEPFSLSDLRRLWADKDNPVSEMVLIMCYSGFRISAYLTIEVSLEEKYFRGGIKTPAGKGRTVPIHSAVLPLVEKRLSRDGKILFNASSFRRAMKNHMRKMGLESHSPHDCRHTFSMLCEKYGVREADRVRMMGHSFGQDLTNGTYGHRTIEELRQEIEKIPGETL